MQVGLAKCLNAWTGVAVVTVGSWEARVRPYDGDSAASVCRLLWRRLQLQADFQLHPSDSRIAVLGPSHSLDFYGNTGTRLGFSSASYSAAASHTADVAHPDGIYPARGLMLSVGGHTVATGSAVADGSAGYAGPIAPGEGTLRLFGTFAELHAWQSALDGSDWDVWIGGRILARIRAVGGAKRRIGHFAAQSWHLAVDVQEVANG